jgi:hypothetical protein
MFESGIVVFFQNFQKQRIFERNNFDGARGFVLIRRFDVEQSVKVSNEIAWFLSFFQERFVVNDVNVPALNDVDFFDGVVYRIQNFLWLIQFKLEIFREFEQKFVVV